MRAGLLLAVAALSQAPPAAAQAEPSTTHVLVITGVGGEPAYSAAFLAQAERVIQGLAAFGIPRARVTWLAEDPAKAAGKIAGRSTREQVLAALQRIGGAAGANDRLLVLLIGHGSDDGVPRFNVPGPDLTAGDLADALEHLGERMVAVVNASSASGGFVEALSGPRRVVITATKTGLERNETRFAESLAKALEGAAADTDKDGALSLQEVYAFASQDVVRFYETENRLRTEHARISDSTLARRFVLAPAGRAAAALAGDSVAAALLARREALEEQIEQLRARKAGMDSTAYERRLEALLLDLARTNQALRERTGKP